MKKRIFALVACMLFAAAFATGCTEKKNDTPKPIPPVEKEKPLEAPKEKEVLEKYEEAVAIFSDIHLGTFEKNREASIIEGDDVYYKIVDERFASYDAFRTYLNEYFTEDFIKENNLLEQDLFLEGKDGYLYALDAARGMNIFYAGYAIGEPEIGEEEVTLEVTAYYTEEEPYEGELFTEEPEDAEDFTTETYVCKLVPEDGAWKFAEFALFY